MKRINNNFDLSDFSRDYFAEQNSTYNAQDELYNAILSKEGLTLPDVLDFSIDVVMPKVLEHQFNPEDEHFRNKLIWIKRLCGLSRSLSKNTKRLLNEMGPYALRNLLENSLYSIGGVGAARLYYYLFPDMSKKVKKYTHKHVLKDGTEIKLLGEIFNNSSEQEINDKIDYILEEKYKIGLPFGQVINKINSGKYDNLYINNIKY